MANKPKPNARYGSERKGSCSPTTKGDAPQPSWWPLPAKMCRQRCRTWSGALFGCLLLQEEKGKMAKREEHSAVAPLCPRERLQSLPPFHNSSSPRLKAVRTDAAFTANFRLVWFYCSLHMVIKCIVSIPTLSLQKCWSTEVIITNVRVNTGTATLLVSINLLKFHLRQKSNSEQNHRADHDHFQNTWTLIQLSLEATQKLRPPLVGARQHPTSIACYWNHGTEQNPRLLTVFLCSWILIFTLTQTLPFAVFRPGTKAIHEQKAVPPSIHISTSQNPKNHCIGT